jgi:hypothetical protein
MHPMLYSIALYSIFAAAALSFILLLFLSAPYGRYMRRGWGLAIKPRWAWLVMESPAVLSILAMAAFGANRALMPLLFLAMWESHYVYRSFVYPFLIRDAGPKSFPISLIAMAMAFNVANGYVNGYFLFHMPSVYTSAWLGEPRFIGGVALFYAGFATHVSSDRTLRRLRVAGARAYGLPYGGLFRFVSCPNYLGEIVQWCGFALATWSVAGLSFAVFTIANLLPRGISHHRWYRENFPDYPPERRAVIPFIL